MERQMKNMLQGDPFKPEFVLLVVLLVVQFYIKLQYISCWIEILHFFDPIIFNLTQISEQL